MPDAQGCQSELRCVWPVHRRSRRFTAHVMAPAQDKGGAPQRVGPAADALSKRQGLGGTQKNRPCLIRALNLLIRDQVMTYWKAH